jgi:ubiquitin C-terminal hydrolase
MSNNDDDNDSRALSGLYNLGNTCYMNATLQCLFATDLFNYYLKKTKFKKDLKYGIINIEIDKCKDILKLNPHITLEKLTEFIKNQTGFDIEIDYEFVAKNINTQIHYSV